ALRLGELGEGDAHLHAEVLAAALAELEGAVLAPDAAGEAGHLLVLGDLLLRDRQGEAGGGAGCAAGPPAAPGSARSNEAGTRSGDSTRRPDSLLRFLQVRGALTAGSAATPPTRRGASARGCARRGSGAGGA